MNSKSLIQPSEILSVEPIEIHVLNFFFIYYWVLLFILFLFSVITFSKFMGVVNSIVFLIARASNHIWRVSLYPLNFNTIAFAYNVMSYDSQRWLPISLNNINVHFNNPSLHFVGFQIEFLNLILLVGLWGCKFDLRVFIFEIIMFNLLDSLLRLEILSF